MIIACCPFRLSLTVLCYPARSLPLLLPLLLLLLPLLLTPILGWSTSSASTYRLRRRGLCPAPTLHDPVSQQSDTTRLQPIRLPHASLLLLLLLLLSSSLLLLLLSSLPTVLSCVCRPALLLIWPISLVHHYHSVHVHRLRPTTRILPWTLGHTLDPPPPAFFLLSVRPSVCLSVCPSVCSGCRTRRPQVVLDHRSSTNPTIYISTDILHFLLVLSVFVSHMSISHSHYSLSPDSQHSSTQCNARLRLPRNNKSLTCPNLTLPPISLGHRRTGRPPPVSACVASSHPNAPRTRVQSKNTFISIQ